MSILIKILEKVFMYIYVHRCNVVTFRSHIIYFIFGGKSISIHSKVFLTSLKCFVQRITSYGIVFSILPEHQYMLWHNIHIATIRIISILTCGVVFISAVHGAALCPLGVSGGIWPTHLGLLPGVCPCHHPCWCTPGTGRCHLAWLK